MDKLSRTPPVIPSTFTREQVQYHQLSSSLPPAFTSPLSSPLPSLHERRAACPRFHRSRGVLLVPGAACTVSLAGGERRRGGEHEHGPRGTALGHRGYLPEAIRNYLARLSWSHGDDEIFSTKQAHHAAATVEGAWEGWAEKEGVELREGRLFVHVCTKMALILRERVVGMGDIRREETFFSCSRTRA